VKRQETRHKRESRVVSPVYCAIIGSCRDLW
jgi:hypothetical protein